MSSYLRRSAFSVVVFASAACASHADLQPSVGITAPAPPALPRSVTAGEQKIIAASNDFSFRLFRQLARSQADSNVFASPFGASMALGLAMNGTAGTTTDQMRSVLSLGGVSDSEVNESYRSLVTLLTGFDPMADFRAGNALWYRNDFAVHQGFIDAGARSYDAQVGALDFANSAAVQTINASMSTATTGRFPTMLDRVDASQTMLLLNAIYFRGTFRDRFDPLHTTAQPFYGQAGEQVTKMMYRVGPMSYFASHELEAVALPFGSGAFAMTIVLPRAGKGIEATIALLQTSGWTQFSSQLRDVGMNLFLPRFRILWDRTLNDDLVAFGMREAFLPGAADFTRMSTRGRELSLGVVKQKTLIDINEDGTVAAATAPLAPSTFGFVPLVMRVERPFIVVIHERVSGTIVFMGKVVRM